MKLEKQSEQKKLLFEQNQSEEKVVFKSDLNTRINIHDAAKRPISEQKPRKKKVVSIKRFKVTKDGVKTEVPVTPLAVSDGFQFFTTEKRVVMTPTGKQQTITVRQISKPRQRMFDFDPKHLETNSLGGMTIVQPLDLQEIGDVGIVPSAP